MQTKLTLRLEDQLIKDAKQYARQSGKSLSQMVAEYFLAITSPQTVTDELTPTSLSALADSFSSLSPVRTREG